MPNMLFANNCNTTLASSLTNVATTLSVTSATGFPAPTGSQYFYCTLADAATQLVIEIVKVTNVTGTTFTIVRGQDGTTGTAYNAGDVVSLRLVRASLNDFPKLDETNTFSQTQTFSQTIVGSINGNAATATIATNIAGGSYGSIPYQSTYSTTSLLPAGTSGQLLVTLGSSAAPAWTSSVNLTSVSTGTLYTTGLTGYLYGNGASAVTASTTIPTSSLSGTLGVANGGTGVTTSTGSGANVLSTSPTLVTPLLGTPTSGTLTNCTGLPLSTGVTGTLSASLGGTGEAGTLTGILYGNGTSAHTVATTAQALSLIGTLPVTNGGTGLTTLTAGYIPYGNGTSAFNSSASLYFDGTNLGIGTTSFTPLSGAARSVRVVSPASNQDADFEVVAGGAWFRSYSQNTSGYGYGGWQHYDSSGNLQAGVFTAGNSAIQFNTANTERARIFASGGFSIGNTTDPGAGNLSVTGSIVSGSTVKTAGYTVATLPTGVTGARTYVTNALAPVFGATVVGGGAVIIPVFYNGTNWIVG